MIDRRPQPLASFCRVERGLYLLRYLEAADRFPPRADLAVLSGPITFVHAPGRDGASLTVPGQCVVVLAEEDGAFEIRVVPSPNGGTDAKFNLEMIDGGSKRATAITDAARLSNTPTSSPRAVADEVEGRIRLNAHVSRRGDVSVEAHEWVAGPDEVLPIEGLALETGHPDLGIRVRVQSLNGGRQWSPWFEAGEFAGSRQKADPLTALALVLTGDAAPQYEIMAETMHLGNPPQEKTGQMVEFFGIDPIVGFRLALNPVKRVAPPGARPASPLRVFRAKR